MLFLLNGDGTMTRLDSGRIFQGSNNFTELGVIYPFSGVTLSAAFTLPNGIDTDYTPMPSLEPYTLKGNNGETKVFENLYYTSTRIPSSVTAMQGDVKVTVLATAAADVGGSTNPTQGTSFSATFTVEYAALPIYTVPDDPTEADFQKLVELLTAYQGTISGNVTELQNRMTTAEGNITSLGERVTTAESEIDDLQERMTAAEGNIEQGQNDISDLQSDKQDKTDNALKTPEKTVVGAINEIYDELTDTSGTGFASRLDTAEAEINVLDSRVEDVEEKTKDPLMTDFTVDVATSTATKFYNNGTQADVTLPTGDTAERINFLASAVFTEEQWTEQSDGTYALTIPASQTGRTNNKYVANLEVTDGSMQVVSADKFLKNEDGSITLKDFSEPWSGRVITVAAGQHGSIIHFGTAVTGTGEQVSADLELRAAAMVGDVYINTNTFEHYTCIAISSTTSTWQYEGTSKGATGNPGKDGTDGTDGKAATVSVGQVTTLPAGSQATVTNSGDENAAVLNFGIPIGNTGQPGADGTDGQDGVGIQNIAADGQDENGGNIYRITLTNGQSYTFVAPKGATGNTGATGATGAPGKDFRIYKTYASVAAMNADASNVPDGEFVMIASTESDPDNAKLYVRTTDGEADFTFVSDLSGAQGIQGEAATIAIGQVLTGEPGTNASVENVGTANAAILNITIPRGNPGTDGTNGTDGAPGKDGADGKAATIQIGEVVTGAAGTNASVENTGTENAAILKFTIPQGQTGTPGTNGADGAPGADGKNGATFTPVVDTNGNLSWTNDGGLPNPETVNVRGAQGEAATVQVGTTTTLPAGSQATVNNNGTSEAAVLNFGIPKGQDGQGVPAGGTVGQVLRKKSGTDYDTEWGDAPSGGGAVSGIEFVDIGEMSGFVFGATGQTTVNITEEQYNRLVGDEYVGIKVTHQTLPIYLQRFTKTIYTASINIPPEGPFLVYIAAPGGSSQKEVTIKVSEISGNAEAGSGGIEVVDLGTAQLTEEYTGGGVYTGEISISQDNFNKLNADGYSVVKINITGGPLNNDTAPMWLSKRMQTDGIFLSGSVRIDTIEFYAEVLTGKGAGTGYVSFYEKEVFASDEGSGGGGLQSTTISAASTSTLSTLISNLAAISSPLFAQISGFNYAASTVIFPTAYVEGTNPASGGGSESIGFSITGIGFNTNEISIEGYALPDNKTPNKATIIVLPSSNVAQMYVSGIAGYYSVDLTSTIFASSFNVTVYHQ